MSDDSIWKRYHKIQKERQVKTTELMEEYDENVYFPALKALQKECETLGHVRGKYHNNGLGWHWFWCNRCGAAFNKLKI